MSCYLGSSIGKVVTRWPQDAAKSSYIRYASLKMTRVCRNRCCSAFPLQTQLRTQQTQHSLEETFRFVEEAFQFAVQAAPHTHFGKTFWMSVSSFTCTICLIDWRAAAKWWSISVVAMAWLNLMWLTSGLYGRAEVHREAGVISCVPVGRFSIAPALPSRDTSDMRGGYFAREVDMRVRIQPGWSVCQTFVRLTHTWDRTGNMQVLRLDFKRINFMSNLRFWSVVFKHCSISRGHFCL